MGWEQMGPLVMEGLDAAGKDQLRDASIRHMEAQNAHLRESDRITAAYHQMQRDWNMERIAVQKEQVEQQARWRTGQLQLTKFRLADNDARHYMDPYRDLLQKQHSDLYRHFMSVYGSQIQHAAMKRAQALVDGDAAGVQTAEAELDQIQQNLRDDPHLSEAAKQADAIQAARVPQHLNVQDQLMLRYVTAVGQSYNQGMQQIPILDPNATRGLATGPDRAAGVADTLLNAINRYLESRGGASPGSAPGVGGTAAPPTSPGPGATTSWGNGNGFALPVAPVPRPGQNGMYSMHTPMVDPLNVGTMPMPPPDGSRPDYMNAPPPLAGTTAYPYNRNQFTLPPPEVDMMDPLDERARAIDAMLFEHARRNRNKP